MLIKLFLNISKPTFYRSWIRSWSRWKKEPVKKRAGTLVERAKYERNKFSTWTYSFKIFFPWIRIFPDRIRILADPDPDSRKKVWSGSGKKTKSETLVQIKRVWTIKCCQPKWESSIIIYLFNPSIEMSGMLEKRIL